MQQQQHDPKPARSGNNRLGVYAFLKNPRTDDFSMEPVASSQEFQADAAISNPHPERPSSKSAIEGTIFKVESASSSLSSPSHSGKIIRPPYSKRGSDPTTKKSSKKKNLEENRNDENPVITLQKRMFDKAQRTRQPSRIGPHSPDPPERQTPPSSSFHAGSFKDIDIRARRPVDRTSMAKERKKPPLYHTAIADTRYPKPQDTLDDVFNVMEHAICPNPQVSMKKDALDAFFGATERLICGPDPRYAYQRKSVAKDDDSDQDNVQKEEKQRMLLLQKAIHDKHVLTNYPSLIVEGAKSQNYNVVMSAAEAASQLPLEAPQTIPPPSVNLRESGGLLMNQTENQDFLDVLCNQVEAVVCGPTRHYHQQQQTQLVQAQHNQQVQNKQDVLDLIFKGVEHKVCGGSLEGGEEEMITFDPEEYKRQALQRLFKPPTRKTKHHDHHDHHHQVSTITSPALPRKIMPPPTTAAFPQKEIIMNNNDTTIISSKTITPPALMRKQAAEQQQQSRRGREEAKNHKLEEQEENSSREKTLRKIPVGHDSKKDRIIMKTPGAERRRRRRSSPKDPPSSRPALPTKNKYNDREPTKKELTREKRATRRDPPEVSSNGILPPSVRPMVEEEPPYYDREAERDEVPKRKSHGKHMTTTTTTEQVQQLQDDDPNLENVFYWVPTS